MANKYYRPVKISEFVSVKEQRAKLERNAWSVARLIELSKELDIFEIPLIALNVYNIYEKLTLREMVTHIRAIEAADLKCPIILDEDGEIMDGRHRIMKAMWKGEILIRAVRFDKNPFPCEVLGD